MDIAKYILIALILNHFTSYAQNSNAVYTNSEKFSITGNVVFENSNEKPPGVNVYLKNTTIGVTTDYNGYFKLSNIENGEYVLIDQFIGYEKYSRKISVNKYLHLNISLKETVLN